MDYGKVLGRAWEITWRWKVLWILGFLVSLGSGGFGGGGNVYSGDNGQGYDFGGWPGEILGPGFWVAFGGIILALLCLGLLIAIALWVVSIIARGGLIAGVQQVEEEGDTSFGRAWRAGASRFWTLLGIAFLAALPFLVLGLGLALVAAAGILVAMNSSNGFSDPAPAGILAAIACGTVFCCGLLILGIVLDQIRTYAERAAILEGLGWLDAFKRGWEVLKVHLGPTIILWLIFVAIGFVLVMATIAGVAAVALPLLAVTAAVEPGPWLIAPACCGGLVALIVFALVAAVIETFTSASWTLAYRELTGIALEVPAEPALEG